MRVDSMGSARVTGACLALSASQSGFPTHGPAVTLVKFQEETASFDTQQTQGLKSGITHMLHVWYIYLRLYRWFLGQMLVNIPNMEHLGNRVAGGRRE